MHKGYFDPKSFRTPSLNLVHHIWGGGHTLETDPTRKGWRCREVTPGRFLVGRPGKEGCASFVWCRDGWDVGVYHMPPAEAHKHLKEGEGVDAHYVEVGNHSGFGLDIIREIEAELLRCA